MNEIKAPKPFAGLERPYIFLAGSIEMGSALPWRHKIVAGLSNLPGTILNPRRGDWDSGWEQTIDNQQFREQVEWELAGLEEADIAIFYFDPGTKSPVTLFEFGFWAIRWGYVIVYCPAGFWRKGNVDVVCARYHVPQAESFEELVAQCREWILIDCAGMDRIKPRN